MAFGTDSGSVGVIDLSSKTVVKLKTKHDVVRLDFFFLLRSHDSICCLYEIDVWFSGMDT